MDLDLRPASLYVRELRDELPARVFKPAPSRILWMGVHLTVIALGAVASASGWLGWVAAPFLSLFIGCSFAGLTFLGHEVLHGAVLRGRRRILAAGWLGFLPFAVSPRLWIAWHNRIHHVHTQQAGIDPDAYPTLDLYRKSRLTRWVTDWFALGGRRWTGLLSLLVGFSIQSLQVLLVARRRGWMSRREHRLAVAETALGIAVWTAVGLAVGPLAFVFVYAIPLVVANSIVMGFILTNHGLSPLTRVNDPLVNALSVVVPRWMDWITLQFGLHVEHHLFPAMSGRHASLVRDRLLAHWPERYQSMPVGRALLALHRTARIYKDETTLIDPRSGREWPTLLPRQPGAPAAEGYRSSSRSSPTARSSSTSSSATSSSSRTSAASATTSACAASTTSRLVPLPAR